VVVIVADRTSHNGDRPAGGLATIDTARPSPTRHLRDELLGLGQLKVLTADQITAAQEPLGRVQALDYSATIWMRTARQSG
jgi:hypothetical protein